MAKIHNLQFLLVILVLTGAFCEEDVLELTDSDFEDRIAEYPTALVFFYAPWCGYCQKLKPDYARAARILASNDPSVALIQIDCTKAGVEICERHSIDSYPTLKIFHYGEFKKNYMGAREGDEIVEQMKVEAKLTIKELRSISELETTLNSTRESMVIGLFDHKSDLKSVFAEAAKKIKIRCQFAYSEEIEVLNLLGLNSAVVLFRPTYLKNNFEPISVTYSGDANVSELNNFIIKNLHGLVGVRKLENHDVFSKPLIVVYYRIDYEKNPKNSNYWRNRVLVVAKDLKENVSFAISSSIEFAQELGKVEIDSLQVENPVAVAYYSSGKKSVLKEKFSVEALREFATNLTNGQLEIYVKSEPIPAIQEGPVTVVVAKNFEEVVVNNGKDTMIKFYAPWCGHCKKLSPIYEELAEKLQGEDIAIVKMNAVANEIPSPYKIDGYPTIYWAAKNKKDNPEMFEGGGSVVNFIKFIAEKATNELKGWDRSGNARVRNIEL